MRKYIRPSLIFIIALTAIYRAWKLKYGFFFFEIFTWILLFGIWIALFIRTIYKESNTSSTLHPLNKISFTAIMTVISIIVAATFIWSKWEEGKPTLILALHQKEYSNFSFDFKTDGTYIYEESAIGGYIRSYGEYTIQNDTIILSHNEIKDLIDTNKLVFTTKTKKEPWLQPAKQSTDTITFDFKIIEDNRNK